MSDKNNQMYRIPADQIYLGTEDFVFMENDEVTLDIEGDYAEGVIYVRNNHVYIKGRIFRDIEYFEDMGFDDEDEHDNFIENYPGYMEDSIVLGIVEGEATTGIPSVRLYVSLSNLNNMNSDIKIEYHSTRQLIQRMSEEKDEKSISFKETIKNRIKLAGRQEL